MLLRDLTSAEISALVQKTHTAGYDARTLERRTEMAARYLAMRERSSDLVRERIAQTFQTHQIGAQVARFATGIFNPIKRLSGRIAKAYTNPPVRQLVGLSEDANRAYLVGLDHLRFNAKCREWNRYQVAMNTIAVMARPCRDARGEPSLDFFKVTGAASEVILDPDQAFADCPAMLAWCIMPDPRARALVSDNRAEQVCIVDADRYYYFDRQDRLVREVEHGLGRFPGAILRATEPEPGDSNDWWDPDTGRSLTEALREGGMYGAILSWARKSMFGKLIVIERDPGRNTIAAEPEQQTPQHIGSPEGAIDLPDGKLNVHDISVGVKEFREHMGLMLAEAARDTTGTASLLDDPTPGQASNDIAEVAKHAALRLLQNEQIEYLRPFEREIAEVMAGIAQRTGMQGFPAPEAMREAFDIEFKPLTFLDTPEARLKHYVEASSFGVADQVGYLQEQGYSEQEARQELRKIAERRAELHEIQASRMLPSDPTAGSMMEVDPAAPGESPAAQTGRYGGRASPALARATE